MTSPTAQLAAFAADLRFDAIPASVVRKTEDLLVDWFGSAVAGHGARPVESITRFAARRMGPGATAPPRGDHQPRRTSPYLAAMANAAASHVAEQDDVHNGSVFHPATVVFPAGAGGGAGASAPAGTLLAAAVAGYEVGIRVGEFLGRSHYKVFHTTGTAGTLAAAAAVGHLLDLDAGQMQHAFGSAGTQSAGLWEFLRTAADSKQLHTAHAAGRRPDVGLPGADGFTGAQRILEGPQGMAAGMSQRRRSRATDRPPGHALGHGRNLVQVPRLVPPHAPGGRCAAAGHARRTSLQPEDLARVVDACAPGRHRRAGPGGRPADRAPEQVLDGHGAGAGGACTATPGLTEFDATSEDRRSAPVATGCAMVLDAEVDAAYPGALDRQGHGHTTDGRGCTAAWTSPRATRATRSAAKRSPPRRCASPRSAAVPRRRDAGRRMRSGAWPPGRAWVPCWHARHERCMASARSFLFVPANRPERFAKALASGADAVIIDLEDAVSPAEKTAARGSWRPGRLINPAERARLVVRMNAPGTPFHDDDLICCSNLSRKAWRA